MNIGTKYVINGVDYWVSDRIKQDAFGLVPVIQSLYDQQEVVNAIFSDQSVWVIEGLSVSELVDMMNFECPYFVLFYLTVKEMVPSNQTWKIVGLNHIQYMKK